jgi:hypothetical protein
MRNWSSLSGRLAAVGSLSHQANAAGKRQQAWNADGGFGDRFGLGVKSEMRQHLPEYFRAGAIGHRLLNKIAGLFGIDSITPAYESALRLADEVRLVKADYGEQPVRSLEGHEPSAPRFPTRKLLHQADKSRIGARYREGHPSGLIDMVGEDLGVSEFIPAGARDFHSAQELRVPSVSGWGGRCIDPMDMSVS